MATSPPVENLNVPARESFGRFVVICMVVTTLAGGLVGYAQSAAGRASDRAGSEADRLTVRASAVRVRRLQLGYAVYDRFALAQEQLAQLASLTERHLGISGAKRGEAFETKIANLRRVAGDTRRSAAALAQRYDLPDITGAGTFGARGDPYFPSRFLRTAERQGVELAALRDAADEESSAWGSDAGAYLAVLTLFAVALYLFGFSLVQHARLPRLFVGAGLVLLATGVTWAAASYATKPQRAPPAAAAEFAAGHVALKNAYQPHEYRRAAAHFTRAIRLRPSFARAYFERGTAHYLAGSPQAAGPASITTAEAHERSIQDMLKAQELGLYTRELLTSLGFSRLVVGLEQRDDDLLERSILLAREAVDAAVERRQDTDAIPHYNLAVALLAAGRLDDAQAAYATAVQKTSSEILTRQQTVAGALTDLQLVVENTSGPVAAAARRLKGFVVASALEDQFTGDSERTPADVHVRSTPGGLQLRNRGGSDPPLCNRDLVAVWYRTPGPGLGSYVPAESLTGSFRQCIPGLRNSVAESHLAASFPAECLPDGSYRLELYDGSNVVAERELRTQWRSAAVDARDIGVRLCRPDGWMTWRGSQPSLDTAVISPDGERGIVVVRLSGSVAHRHHARVLATLLQRYRRLVGATADGGAEARRAFMDIPRATTRQYLAGGKRILAGIGSDADGSTVAAFVFGPRRWFGGTTPNALFDSLVLGYQPI